MLQSREVLAGESVYGLLVLSVVEMVRYFIACMWKSLEYDRRSKKIQNLNKKLRFRKLKFKIKIQNLNLYLNSKFKFKVQV